MWHEVLEGALNLIFSEAPETGKNWLKTLAEADDEVNERCHIVSPLLYWRKKDVSVKQLTQDANLVQLEEENDRANGVELPHVDFS